MSRNATKRYWQVRVANRNGASMWKERLTLEEIQITEAHDYFLKSYPNKIEESVLGELSSWIEDHFGTKVKKIAFLDSGSYMGVPVKRLDVFIYYENDFLKLSPLGIITWGEVAEANSKLILNSAWETIHRYKSDNYFANLQVITLRCFEDIEISSIAALVFRDEIDKIRSFLMGDGVEKVWVVSPFNIIILFFKNKESANIFHDSEKRKQLDLILYEMAKSRDLYEFITPDIIKKFYAYADIKDFAPNCDFRHYKIFCKS